MEIPSVVYLQVKNDDGDEVDEVTWSAEKIYEKDIRYIRADIIASIVLNTKPEDLCEVKEWQNL